MIYEFECKCGYVFDKLTNEDIDKAKCPKCGKIAKRIISICFFNIK